MQKKYSGFSLIELSIVILIIGVLVIGISKGSRIIKESKLKSALALTAGSPVNSMEGLVLWLDTTDKNNIAVSSVFGNVTDGDFVSDWKDRNSQSVNKNILSNPISGSRPQYVQNGIGGLPTLKFDGVDDLLVTASAPLAAGDDDYTMIVVWSSLAINTNTMLLEQKNISASNNQSAGIYLAFSNPSQVVFTCYSNDTPSIGTVSIGTNFITSFVVNHNNASADVVGFNNTINGTVTAVTTRAAANVGNAGFSIGGRFTDLVGHSAIPSNVIISEVIIFERALKISEIKSINTYLSQKYSIKLN